MPALDIEKALKILDINGPFSQILKGFEPRDQQNLMMRNVIEAYNQNAIALIEAGTGTGKSLAYLIPAILWAAQFNERTVISTNTITLQEQLLSKDIPLVAKALNVEIKAVIVKGMHNYLCLRKLDDAVQETLLMPPHEVDELYRIDAWKDLVHDGSRSALPFAPSYAIWERVSAESDACSRNSCPSYQQCLFFKARRQAQDAQILIVNHHMLFADLIYRSENKTFEEPSLLPAYNRLIIDEAHNVEDVATEYFAEQISQLDILRLMARLTSEKGEKIHGKLPVLKQRLLDQYRQDLPKEAASIHSRLSIDLPGMRRDLIQQTQEAFDHYQQFMRGLAQSDSATAEHKLRLFPYHYKNTNWQEKLIPKTTALCATIDKYAQSLKALENDFKAFDTKRFDELFKNLFFDIISLANRLQNYSTTLKSFMSEPGKNSRVRWIESQQLKTISNISLIDADLDISQKLVDFLFNKLSTVVLCSATLTSNQRFDFIRHRLGLNSEFLHTRSVTQNAYDSPFNFNQQVLLTIPSDLPNPTDGAFIASASEKIWETIQISHGNAFVLFTSYSMLKSVHEILENRMKEHRFNPLKQGDDDRQALLSKFKNKDRSVLFGTDSFWEGIDVVGEALRCVIIVKLPFKVPTEPLIQARSEAVLAKGGDPFTEYSLPQAIVKFKQGFGRLIRNRKDRGCIVVLDHRLVTKRYGQQFLNSLPPCQVVSAPFQEIQQKMKEFYRKTYSITRS